jgi:hypothetical protein
VALGAFVPMFTLADDVSAAMATAMFGLLGVLVGPFVAYLAARLIFGRG